MIYTILASLTKPNKRIVIKKNSQVGNRLGRNYFRQWINQVAHHQKGKKRISNVNGNVQRQLVLWTNSSATEE